MEVSVTEGLSALLVMQCARCKESNEIEIPVDDRRVFSVQCCRCHHHSQVTLDTGGQPLLIAEGLPDWERPPGAAAEPTPPSSASVPPKKRQKTALLAPAPAPSESVPCEAELVAPASQPPKPKPKARPAARLADDGPKLSKAVQQAAAKPSKLPKLQKQPSTQVLPRELKSPKATKADDLKAMLTTPNRKKHSIRRGSSVISEFGDGYFYSAMVEEAQGHSSFLVAWDDGDPSSWVSSSLPVGRGPNGPPNRQSEPPERAAKPPE